MEENKQKNSCCCTDEIKNKNTNNVIESWIIDYKDTVIGKIPVVATKLLTKDIATGCLVRWTFKKNNYKINPGLYCVGNPSEESAVLVTANYKLTFDKLRKELNGFDAWILVLDTKGINVWCAAGKGTFGTEELINKISMAELEKIISHRNLILPQLGAVGVSAHTVKQRCGFKVIYGPVRAKDIIGFLKNNYNKTEEMRTVKFGFYDRIILIPVEFVQSLKYIFIAFVFILILGIIDNKSINIRVITDFIPYLGAFIIGLVFIPALLPLIPFRSFSLKGLLVGLIWAAIIEILYAPEMIAGISNFLIFPSLTVILAMNFTGATTFTSQTGTKLEVKYTIIPVIAALSIGIILKGVSVFI